MREAMADSRYITDPEKGAREYDKQASYARRAAGQTRGSSPSRFGTNIRNPFTHRQERGEVNEQGLPMGGMGVPGGPNAGMTREHQWDPAWSNGMFRRPAAYSRPSQPITQTSPAAPYDKNSGGSISDGTQEPVSDRPRLPDGGYVADGGYGATTEDGGGAQYNPGLNAMMGKIYPGWEKMSAQQRAAIYHGMPHNDSGGVNTGTPLVFNRRGESTNAGTEGAQTITYDPRRDTKMATPGGSVDDSVYSGNVARSELPQNASRGVWIDPKYQTPASQAGRGEIVGRGGAAPDPRFGTGYGDTTFPLPKAAATPAAPYASNPEIDDDAGVGGYNPPALPQVATPAPAAPYVRPSSATPPPVNQPAAPSLQAPIRTSDPATGVPLPLGDIEAQQDSVRRSQEGAAQALQRRDLEREKPVRGTNGFGPAGWTPPANGEPTDPIEHRSMWLNPSATPPWSQAPAAPAPAPSLSSYFPKPPGSMSLDLDNDLPGSGAKFGAAAPTTTGGPFTRPNRKASPLDDEEDEMG